MAVMLACSFCGKQANATGALLAGPGVNICDQCVEVGVRAIATRDALEEPLPTNDELHGTEDETLLNQMAATSKLVDHTRDRLQRQVAELRRRGLGWSVIGAALCLSHQTAQDRFG